MNKVLMQPVAQYQRLDQPPVTAGDLTHNMFGSSRATGPAQKAITSSRPLICWWLGGGRGRLRPHNTAISRIFKSFHMQPGSRAASSYQINHGPLSPPLLRSRYQEMGVHGVRRASFTLSRVPTGGKICLENARAKERNGSAERVDGRLNAESFRRKG